MGEAVERHRHGHAQPGDEHAEKDFAAQRTPPYLKVYKGEHGRGDCHGNSRAGKADVVDIAGGVQHRAKVERRPPGGGQRQRQRLDKRTGAQRNAAQPQRGGLRPARVEMRGGDQAEQQHDRQVDGLGRAMASASATSSAS